MIIIFRNLSIAILIWMLIFFLHGFFSEFFKILKKRCGDWENRKRILREADKLTKKKLLEWKIGKKGRIRITVKKNENN